MGIRTKIFSVNIGILALLLVTFEVGARLFFDEAEFEGPQGMGQVFAPYVMFTERHRADQAFKWKNTFTGAFVQDRIVTNKLGFRTRHEFSLTAKYRKQPNERVILLTGGSAAWGVGATSNAATVARRMEHYLNTFQKQTRYTVVNLASGSWVSYQEFIALDLWGRGFDPEWVVIMDGINDIGVACGASQGLGNPYFYPLMQAYIDGYLTGHANPSFYRGWVENQIVKYSKAYRVLTGKRFVPRNLVLDWNNKNKPGLAIEKTPWSAAVEQAKFYVRTQESMVNLFPQAKYILSTQPSVNTFSGTFPDFAARTGDVETDRKITVGRERALDVLARANINGLCRYDNYSPAHAFFMGRTAIDAERLAGRLSSHGRTVIYHNVGKLFPDPRESRKPYFVDPVHLSDKGMDALGDFYAREILKTDNPSLKLGAR